jgi:hypothetical protein
MTRMHSGGMLHSHHSASLSRHAVCSACMQFGLTRHRIPAIFLSLHRLAVRIFDMAKIHTTVLQPQSTELGSCA